MNDKITFYQKLTKLIDDDMFYIELATDEAENENNQCLYPITDAVSHLLNKIIGFMEEELPQKNICYECLGEIRFVEATQVKYCIGCGLKY